MNNITKALSGILALSSYSPAIAKDNRPNLIFILADDLSAKTLGCASESPAHPSVFALKSSAKIKMILGRLSLAIAGE